MTVKELAKKYGFTSPAYLRDCLDKPYLQALDAEVREEAMHRLTAALLVFQSATLKAAQNISAAVDRGDLRQSQFVLAPFLPRQAQPIEVSGAVHHSVEAHHTVAAALAGVRDILQAKAAVVPAPEQFLRRGADGVTVDLLPSQAGQE
jgi:hypothetical protein